MRVRVGFRKGERVGVGHRNRVEVRVGVREKVCVSQDEWCLLYENFDNHDSEMRR